MTIQEQITKALTASDTAAEFAINNRAKILKLVQENKRQQKLIDLLIEHTGILKPDSMSELLKNCDKEI